MKERYIEMRNKKVIDLYFFYDYAVSKGFTLSFDEFNYGAQWLMVEATLDQLDIEYELTKIHDKNGNFIKVIA